MRVTINAGHAPAGNPDPGAVSPVNLAAGDKFNTVEAIWCAAVAHMACDILVDKGHAAQFVQSDSLEEICELSDAFDSDIFVSLHINAAGATEAQGPETYYYPYSDEGERLAKAVHSKLVQKLGANGRDRGVKAAGFYVLRNTNAPAILIEAGFITNIWEESQLNEPWAKEAVAEAIVESVLKYANLKEE